MFQRFRNFLQSWGAAVIGNADVKREFTVAADGETHYFELDIIVIIEVVHGYD